MLRLWYPANGDNWRNTPDLLLCLHAFTSTYLFCTVFFLLLTPFFTFRSQTIKEGKEIVALMRLNIFFIKRPYCWMMLWPVNLLSILTASSLSLALSRAPITRRAWRRCSAFWPRDPDTTGRSADTSKLRWCSRKQRQRDNKFLHRTCCPDRDLC